MSNVRLLIGPAGSGKTARCIQWLRVRAALEPLTTCWVVVPDRLQARYFRQRLGQAGGILGVQVGTFDDLYAEILGRGGRFLALAPEVVLRRLVRLAVRDALGSGHLRHFAPIAERPGFLAVAEEHIAELQREAVSPEELASACANGDAGALELGHVYRAYARRLAQLGVTDLAARTSAAVRLLHTDGRAVAWLHGLVVDGFDSFEGHQLHSLGALARLLDNLLITLPGDASLASATSGGSPRSAHLRFARALERLKETTRATIETIEGTFWAFPALRQLEAQLFVSPGTIRGADSQEQPSPGTGSGAARPEEPSLRTAPCAASPEEPSAGTGAGAANRPSHLVEFLEVRSPADEAREALRWLKARCVRDGVALDECAIITPDPEHYRPLLRAAAEEFGLPVRFTMGQPLLEAPRMVALLQLLRLPLDDYPRRALLDSLRAPFFDLSVFGLSRQDADALEVLSRRALVLGGQDEWLNALDTLAQQLPRQRREDEEEDPAALAPTGERAAALARGLRALAAALNPPPRPLGEWVRWLEDLMVTLGYAPGDGDGDDRDAGISAADDDGHGGDAGLSPAEGDDGDAGLSRLVDELDIGEQAAHSALQEVLRSLLLTDRLLGEPTIRYAAFLAELEDLVDTTAFHPALNPGTPAVRVLRLLEARGPRFQAVAVLGLSEGLLPQVEREDPFLPDSLRLRLGLEPRLGREQRGLFYLAVTRAARYLLLSRPYLDDSGEEWQPSPYWRAALAAVGVGQGAVRRLTAGTPQPLYDAGSAAELVFWAARGGVRPPAASGVEERRQRLADGAAVVKSRLARQAGGPYDGLVVDLRPHLAEAFGPPYVWSASRLETYASCPLRFYVEVILSLSALEPPGVGLDAAQLGSIYHQVLERAYRTASDPTDIEAVLAAMHKVAPTVFAEAPARLGFRPTAWWEAEQSILLEDLEAAVRGLAENDGGWRPVALEASFGIENEPLRLNEADEMIQLRGIIDRVDRNAAGQLRVIDYKTGSSHLAERDLVNGRRLQLPLYALAAQQVLKLGEAVDGFYWAIRQAHKGNLRLSSFEHATPEGTYRGPPGAAELAVRHATRFVRLVREGHFEPRPPPDGCPSYCAATPWCWRYTAGPWR